MTTETQLIEVESLNAAVVFGSRESIDDLLAGVRSRVDTFVPDVETNKGRKEIASMAHKVAQSKTALDALGKTLVADWKAKSKLVDASRKHARDELDALKVQVRQPLTVWEAEQEALDKAEALRIQMDEDHAEALSMNDLIDREKRVAEQEEAIRQQERDRIEAEQKAEAEERARKREEKIRVEAAEKAEQDAAEAVAKAEQDALDAIERGRQQQEAAATRERETAERVERERIAAEETAAQEKAEAEETARQKLLAEQKADQEKAERRAKRRAHRDKIEAAALASLLGNDIEQSVAKKVLVLIADEQIANVRVVY